MNASRGPTGLAIILLLLIGTVAIALLIYLRWRDTKREATGLTSASTVQTDLNGTVYGLVPGGHYQVRKSFTDFYGNSFEQGELLRFKQRYFLPYHGGHTIFFEHKALYLQEDQNKEILDYFSEYIIQIDADSKPGPTSRHRL